MKIIVASAAAAAIGFADAKFTRGSLYKTKEHADRHLDSTELSMPGQPGDNSGITELLADDGVSKEIVSGFLTALDISAAKMSSGPARDLCTTILDEILDFFLFRREVEEAIKVIICGEDEELTITSLKPSQSPSDVPSAIASLKPSHSPSDVPSAKPSDVPSQSPGPIITCGGDIKEGETCSEDGECGCGLFCNPGTLICSACKCGTSSGSECSSHTDCGSVLCVKTSDYNVCPNMRA
eukprot:CAMPEP_0181098632 /NCGR_PEP_ID=MMETSP1071-20121207/12230_1 /TAXON_ID=35127 /ORGANISM="Thalassiosira sp., Strain NH16" /LENGTH=238 /DNA_ID=CAMNT_0023181241 /DNA_START=48 /DNA_END=764 /DNA_ORIENTATION=-